MVDFVELYDEVSAEEDETQMSDASSLGFGEEMDEEIEVPACENIDAIQAAMYLQLIPKNPSTRDRSVRIVSEWLLGGFPTEATVLGALIKGNKPSNAFLSKEILHAYETYKELALQPGVNAAMRDAAYANELCSEAKAALIQAGNQYNRLESC